MIVVSLMVALAPVWLGARATPVDEPSITVHGAAGQVSGSNSILEIGGKKWVIDCGTFMPEVGDTAAAREAWANTNSSTVPEDELDADGVFLTHAHIDHIGRVPLLVREGYRGPIYATEGTIQLAAPMLLSNARYDEASKRNWMWSSSAASAGKNYITGHWMAGCQSANSISPKNATTFTGTVTELTEQISRGGPRKSVSPCRACAELEVAGVIKQMKAVKEGKSFTLPGGMTATPYSAGHIPGSCSWLLETKAKKGKKGKRGAPDEVDTPAIRILFSGDLGWDGSTLIEGPEPAPPVDVVLIETTYGCSNRTKPVDEGMAEFRKAVSDTIAEGGIAWIPSFALDRTQKVLHQLRIAQREGLIRENVPIFVPSPSARAVTEVYERNSKKGWFRDLWAKDKTNLRPPGYEDSEEAFDDWMTRQSPAILVSTGGLLDVAFGGGSMRPLLDNPKVTVFLVGYQDPFSPGGQMADSVTKGESTAGKTIRTPDGKTVDIKVQTKRLGGFSAHGRANEIDAWLANQDKETCRVLLVHGESQALKDRQKCLEDQGWKHVMVPERAKPVELVPQSKTSAAAAAAPATASAGADGVGTPRALGSDDCVQQRWR